MVDRGAPAELLGELIHLAASRDRVVSVGPAPDYHDLRLPIRALHRPMNSAVLCGLRMTSMTAPPDVLHAWSLTAARAAYSAALRWKVPMVASAVSCESLRRHRWLVGAARNGAVALSVPTAASRNRALAMGAPEPAVAVLPPVAHALRANGVRAAVRRALGLGEREALMLAPAAMIRPAGHVYAAWAHAIVSHIHDHVRLALPGTGPAERRIRSFVRKTRFEQRTLLTGWRFGPHELMAAADLAVFLHEQDCGVGALAAAMAAGLPIIASCTAEVRDCVGHEREALLVPPRRPKEHAAAVLRLIDQVELARRLGQAAARRAADQFGLARSRAALVNIYSRLAPS